MPEPEIEDLHRRVCRLERANRGWRAVGLLALAVAVAAVAIRGAASAMPGLASPSSPQDEAPGDPSALVEAQRDLASRALAMIERSIERGVGETRALRAAHAFSIRLLASELFLSLPDDAPRTLDPELYLSTALAPPSPDRLAAFEAHLDRMRRWEDLFRPLLRDRVLSPLDYAELQHRRIEAEVLAARERLRLDDANRPPAAPERQDEEGPSGR